MSMGQPPVDDQTYNLLQILVSKLEACAAYEVYLEDMDGDAVDVLKEIAADDERHTQKLLNLLGIRGQ